MTAYRYIVVNDTLLKDEEKPAKGFALDRINKMAQETPGLRVIAWHHCNVGGVLSSDYLVEIPSNADAPSAT
jgi:hypothetical protein